MTMIECGQADSFLFQQENFVALVDCGTRSTGDDVVEYLKSIGITKIDLLFGTHPHDDHMGGMYDVITNFEIGKIIIPKIKVGEVTTNWYLKLVEEIKNKNHTVEYPTVNTVYTLGDATMTVLGPLSEPDDNLNNYSIVMKVTYGNMDVLMTGDAEKEVEAEIIASGVNLDAEILKVGHHGSNTSSTEAFLDAIAPDYALISCKVGNKHDHPTAETMEKLKERNIEVYRTDESGTVILTITANDVTFNTDPDDYKSGIELAGGS
ncbi:MAG: MBL fold metallo-hydrolase [Clostridia bacterium]|nr:MBL fold metallo-hydrolase [Clostridia bacterium]